MTRDEALFEVKQSILTEWEKSFIQRAKEANSAMEAIVNKIYDDFEKEKEQLKRDRDYWKLSFEKQVEASMK